MSGTYEIRAILFQEGGLWVAQCLEYDIGTQASDLEELQNRLRATIDAECLESVRVNGEPFKGIDPAPGHYHAMWEKRAGSFQPMNPKHDDHVKVELGLAA